MTPSAQLAAFPLYLTDIFFQLVKVKHWGIAIALPNLVYVSQTFPWPLKRITLIVFLNLNAN